MSDGQDGMTPERWRRIQELLDQAFERPAAEREAFLSGLYDEDPALIADVRSLLEQDDSDRVFESALNAQSAGSNSFPTELGSLAGCDVGRYHVVARAATACATRPRGSTKKRSARWK